MIILNYVTKPVHRRDNENIKNRFRDFTVTDFLQYTQNNNLILYLNTRAEIRNASL